MFLLDRAKPKVLTEQKIEQIEKYLEKDKMIILNNSDFLKIEYTNIFGQIIDTTFTNAKELNEIKICVNKYKDYEKKSLIKESIHNDKSAKNGHSIPPRAG
jgi:S-adenosylmethionine:tRNA-ribosyltransferase-isomerase (queuine synthetase)